MNVTNRLQIGGLACACLALLVILSLRPTVVGDEESGRDRVDPPRPNIVIIMADDLGFADVGCYGGEIATPNIDRLAAGGLRFTQFYNTARCCPTRAALLTGLYPHQAGVGSMISDESARRGPAYLGRLNDRCVTIAEVLGAAGYRTYLSGKWHVGEERPHWPVDRGFDRSYGPISGAMNYFDISKPKAPGVVRHFAIDDQPHTPPSEGFYITDAITENAVKYIRGHDPETAPFFLYVPYTAPHWPLHALPEDIERYRGKYMDGWDALRRRRHARQKEMALVDEAWALSPRDPQAADWEALDDATKELMDLKMAIYAAQVDRMDRGIGRIIEALEQAGALENTLVMFLSDNGACAETGPLGRDWRNNGLPPGGVDSYMSYGRSWSNAGNTPFRMHKKWIHEGGISSPLIAHWPAGIAEPGGITRQVGHVIDIMPTCCELAGVEYPEEYEGRAITPVEGLSLAPIFTDGERQGHEALFWEHIGNRGVRLGRWKLVSTSGGRWELYDIEADRTELHNLAGQHPEIARELLLRYRAWAKRCGVEGG